MGCPEARSSRNTGAAPINSTGEPSNSRSQKNDGAHIKPTSTSPLEKGSSTPRIGPETRDSTESEACCPNARPTYSTTASKKPGEYQERGRSRSEALRDTPSPDHSLPRTRWLGVLLGFSPAPCSDQQKADKLKY